MSLIAYCFLKLNPIGALAVNMGFSSDASLIWLSKVHCHGTENKLVDCPATQEKCLYYGNAGVRCNLNGTHQPCKFQTMTKINV